MATAPNTSTYLLYTADTADLPNSRILSTGTGLKLTDRGPAAALTLEPTGTLQAIAELNSSGYISYNSTLNTMTSRVFQNSSSINVTNIDGVSGASVFSVIPNSTVQQIQVKEAGVLKGTRSTLNFIGGENTGITVVDNAGSGSIDVNIVSGSNNAPGAATYILKTPNANLPNAFALNSLDDGILKNNSFTGTPSIAFPGFDYQAPSTILTSIAATTPSLGSLLVGNGAGYTTLAPGATGTALVSTGTSSSPTFSVLPGTGTVTSVHITSSGSTLAVTGASNPITVAGTINLDLPVKGGLTPGSYTFASLTVDQHGLLTAASSGSPGTVTSVNISSPGTTIVASGGPITTTGTFTVDLATTGITAGTYTNPTITLDTYSRATSISSGAGTVFTWNTNVLPGPINMTANNGYVTKNNGAPIVHNLPTSANVGDTFRVVCYGSSSTGLSIVAPSGRSIYWGVFSGTTFATTGATGQAWQAFLSCIDATPGSEIYQVWNYGGSFLPPA